MTHPLSRRLFIGSMGAGLALAHSDRAAAEVPGSGPANPLDAIKPIPGNGARFGGMPPALGSSRAASYLQPWSGFDPPCTLDDQNACAGLPSLTYNQKPTGIYDGIQIQADHWVKMAADAATRNVHGGDRPFGAVMVQVDDQTDEVLRYWVTGAHVYAWSDPTAHAEVVAIRAACRDLGVGDLGRIERAAARLPQSGETSRCVLFSSTESCPMCQAAEYWAGLRTVVFGATRYDAAQQGIGIDQGPLYEELALPYRERRTIVRQSSVPNSLDAFNLLKRSRKTR